MKPWTVADVGAAFWLGAYCGLIVAFGAWGVTALLCDWIERRASRLKRSRGGEK